MTKEPSELEKLLARVDDDDCPTPEFEAGCAKIYELIGPWPREVLKQLLFKGPVCDGDISSKSARNALLTLGLAVRCCFKGGQGYTAASYRGGSVFQYGYKAAAEKLVSGFFGKRQS